MKSFIVAAISVASTLLAVFAVRIAAAPRHPMPGTELLTDATTQPKQLWTCGMHPQVIQDHPGNCPICHMKLVPLKSDADDSSTRDSTTAPGANRKIIYYWDPMLGPSSIAHAPGKSAMGMDLVPVYADQQSAGPTVRIDPAIVQNMGIQTAQVQRGPLIKTVRAIGILESPETDQYEINLKISGWIAKLYANQEGMHVHKGEPLFDVYSPDLQVADEELIGAVKSLKSLEPTSPPELRSESESMVSSAKQKLRLWGIAGEDIETVAASTMAPATIPFRSPADGDVIDKSIVEGSAIQAGSRVMRIEDHSHLWLEAQVYADDIPFVAIGQTVSASIESEPGKSFSGPITFIYPHMDHMARTLMVRVTLDNVDHDLHPGMYATANIKTRPIADALLVPREAVIDTGNWQIAFVVMDQGHFEPRRVRMGLMGDDDRVQILEGLAPGETVVTSGQFLLDVESRTTEAIDKLRNYNVDPKITGGGMAP